jgi:pimeloyl-ACP methyl ester carboxylesterase
MVLFVALATIIMMSGVNFLLPSDSSFKNNSKENSESNFLEQNISSSNNNKISSMEKISFITKDKIKIIANLYTVDKPLGWVIFVHMMPAAKESYDHLAKRLQNLGYEGLALDLRGHGESTFSLQGDALNYAKFTDEEHQKSILDLEAAVDYLIKERKANAEKIIFIGASIGANLALQYLSEHFECKNAILLSPGLNYRGIITEPLVKNLRHSQRVFFIGSKDDQKAGGDSAYMNQRLYDLTPAGVEKRIQIYDTGGHGTDILISHPSLSDLIIQFLAS